MYGSPYRTESANSVEARTVTYTLFGVWVSTACGNVSNRQD